MKKLILFLALAVVLGFHPVQADSASAAEKLQDAFQNQRSHVQIEGKGVVLKLLREDREGRKHQKFLLKLASGQTILIAHNIDLSTRIENLAVGDEVAFYGEYEWNNKGGLIHWTHHDPQARHINGWLKHQNKTYQ